MWVCCCLVWLGVNPPDGRAQDDPLRPCLHTLIGQARDLGARAAGPVRSLFLLAPDSDHVDFAVPEKTCLGVLAIGRRQVQALRMRFYDPDGKRLANVQEELPYGYGRACPAEAMTLRVQVRILAGGGEVLLVPLYRAPSHLAGVGEALDQCPGVGLPGPSEVDVGPPLLGVPAEARLVRLAQWLGETGYLGHGRERTGAIGVGGRALLRLPLKGGQCWAVAVEAEDPQVPLELQLFSPPPSPRLLARTEREGVVRACVAETGRHLLVLHSSGGGFVPYRMRVFRLPPPPAAEDSGHWAGLPSAEQVALWETLWQLRRVGMAVRQQRWLQLPRGGHFRMPLPLQGHTCYALALQGLARSTSGGGAPALDLQITDGRGNTLAYDGGWARRPLVFVCPETDGPHGVHVRVLDGGPSVRALLLVAADR